MTGIERREDYALYAWTKSVLYDDQEDAQAVRARSKRSRNGQKCKEEQSMRLIGSQAGNWIVLRALFHSIVSSRTAYPSPLGLPSTYSQPPHTSGVHISARAGRCDLSGLAAPSGTAGQGGRMRQ
jgi:hypothetical protein